MSLDSMATIMWLATALIAAPLVVMRESRRGVRLAALALLAIACFGASWSMAR